MQACGKIIGWSGEFVTVMLQGTSPYVIEHPSDCKCEFCRTCRSARQGLAARAIAVAPHEMNR